MLTRTKIILLNVTDLNTFLVAFLFQRCDVVWECVTLTSHYALCCVGGPRMRFTLATHVFLQPPGAGKTYLVKQMSKVCEMPLFGVHTHQVEAASSIKNLFSQARENYPSLVFLDDVENIFANHEQHPPCEPLVQSIREEIFLELGPRKLKIQDPDSATNPTQQQVQDPDSATNPTQQQVQDPDTATNPPQQQVQHPDSATNPTQQQVQDPDTATNPPEQQVQHLDSATNPPQQQVQ